MIVLEGPDGAGKTTLLENIIKVWHGLPPNNYDVQVIHSPGPLEKGLYEWSMKTLKQVKPVCILDRFPYFSEQVYGPALRPRACMTILEFQALKERLTKISPLIIYCRPPMAVLQVARRVRDQMPGVLDHYEEIVDAYDRAYASWIKDFRILTFDHTRGDEAYKMVRYAIETYILEEQRGSLML